MKAVLGIDTSCYTTSAALVPPQGELLASARRLLVVEDGARGLQQSQGLFQHVKNLPQTIEKVMADVPQAQICALEYPPEVGAIIHLMQKDGSLSKESLKLLQYSLEDMKK